MPRKQKNARQSLGNPFPHLPLIESKDHEPAVAKAQMLESGQETCSVIEPVGNDLGEEAKMAEFRI